ncbi:cytochrome c peroxidase [Bradyrhizobium sp. cir1]|nr:hypothetical protein [Bradyrhizobium sp. cir1]MBB4370654.1 cytochrome c peroxidase [Bradyrhizobium sp. cir1]
MFSKAFPNDAAPVTFENLEGHRGFRGDLDYSCRPLDQYLDDDGYALTDQQKAELKLFIEKGCSSCHNGINVGGQDYFPFGMIKGQPKACSEGRQGSFFRHQGSRR